MEIVPYDTYNASDFDVTNIQSLPLLYFVNLINDNVNRDRDIKEAGFKKLLISFKKGPSTLFTEAPVKINVNPSEPDANQPGSIKLYIGTDQNITWTGTFNS